jgi:hypothetical protein
MAAEMSKSGAIIRRRRPARALQLAARRLRAWAKLVLGPILRR